MPCSRTCSGGRRSGGEVAQRRRGPLPPYAPAQRGGSLPRASNRQSRRRGAAGAPIAHGTACLTGAPVRCQPPPPPLRCPVAAASETRAPQRRDSRGWLQQPRCLLRQPPHLHRLKRHRTLKAGPHTCPRKCATLTCCVPPSPAPSCGDAGKGFPQGVVLSGAPGALLGVQRGGPRSVHCDVAAVAAGLPVLGSGGARGASGEGRGGVLVEVVCRAALLLVDQAL